MTSPHKLRRSLVAVVSIVGLALVVAACGSSSSSSSSASTPTSSTPASGTTASASTGTTVPVTLKDFSITMPKMAMAAGTYTFKVSNSGPSSHNLTIVGPGVSTAATPTFPSGQTHTLTVKLQKGKYDFFCSVPGHKQAGMNVEVTVT